MSISSIKALSGACVRIADKTNSLRSRWFNSVTEKRSKQTPPAGLRAAFDFERRRCAHTLRPAAALPILRTRPIPHTGVGGL